MKGKNVKKNKGKEKRWNLNLNLPWKDLEMKFRGIIKDYKKVLFLKFKKKLMFFVRATSFWKLCVRFGFLVIFPLFESFWICNFGILYIIKDYICERNFMPFGYVMKDIQISKVLASILKLVSFESDNFLWSSSI